ncbi:hypothetical protein [Plantactinospora sp. KBS50]|uniref:hypothetical protein n=1 Tax=Plantactinospora sp. KBS50 TaxID=2024580 RepID=UPI000BAAA1A6|nr:hypothetical protein [Plantactinospora sp. KBS50]ASW53954.1 hypothetical protein CIK06_06810 [Plantactinospora sp. KBS50]
MARFSRRKATTVAIGAFALALLGGGVAAAAPNDSHPAAARAEQPGIGGPAAARGSAAQPAVSKAEAAAARAALAPSDATVADAGTKPEFAVVESNGTLVRGYHAVSAARLGVGEYQVVFTHDVRQSAYVATTGFTGSLYVPPPGIVVVAGRTGISNGVFIATYDTNGALVDRAFHLVVTS